MSKEREVLKLALEALENNKQKHHYCEDTWYSCPKHEDGCANEAEGDECNCGADEINAQFDKAITAIKEALAQPEQEEKLPPVEIGVDVTDIGTTVVAFYRRPNAVMEMFYSQFHPLAQPEQEPVAWLHTKIEGVAVPHRPADLDKHPERWGALYKAPLPCPTCEALARTVMMDQTGRDA